MDHVPTSRCVKGLFFCFGEATEQEKARTIVHSVTVLIECEEINTYILMDIDDSLDP